jgi:hypothetical protein
MPNSALRALCRPPGYAERNGECAGQRGSRLLHGRHNPAVTAFLMDQARQCARAWSTKTLATPRASLLRFPQVESVISALLVGCGPGGGGLEVARLPPPDGEATDHTPWIMPITARLNRR